jgi:hypothetical protein
VIDSAIDFLEMVGVPDQVEVVRARVYMVYRIVAEGGWRRWEGVAGRVARLVREKVGCLQDGQVRHYLALIKDALR